MRLTRAGEYAVRAVLYLAGKGTDRVVGRQEIAKEMEIPGQFLAKIGQQLAKAGFIEIVQGSKGGFRLRVSPEQLTLLNVVEAVEGEIFLNDCIMDPDSCWRSPNCAVHKVWNRARNQLRECLGEATFSSLMAEDLCTRHFPSAAGPHDDIRDKEEQESTLSKE